MSLYENSTTISHSKELKSVTSINFTQQYTLLNNNLGLLSPFKPFRHGDGISENISLPQGSHIRKLRKLGLLVKFYMPGALLNLSTWWAFKLCP
jgi:hypothetical protein